MSQIISVLYALSCLLLVAEAYFVWRRNPQAYLHKFFAIGSVFVAIWLSTLFEYERLQEPSVLILIGRINFAAVLFVSTYSFLFVRELTGQRSEWRRRILWETAILVALTLASPLFDRAELITSGQHVTQFGILFPIYIVHVFGLLIAALIHVVKVFPTATRRLKNQLGVIGVGMMFSVLVAGTTNLILPYAYNIFEFQEIGALSTIAFIASAAYSITVNRLFDVRIVVKRTIVFAILIGLVEKGYAGIIEIAVQHIPGADSSPQVQSLLSSVAIIFIAASFHPVRLWLERTFDSITSREKKKVDNRGPR